MKTALDAYNRSGVVKQTTTHMRGLHSLEVCYLDCVILSSEAKTKKTIKSYCIVLVAEHDLQFVQVNTDDQIDFVRAFIKGSKYSINFKNISDISVLKGDDGDQLPMKAVKNGVEPQPRSICLHLHGGALCKIDTNGYGSTRLSKQIQSAWQSSLLLRSSQLAKLHTAADTSIANEYLTETINGVKCRSKNAVINTEKSFPKIIEIFDEFAVEAWVDLELKEVTCRSREFFVSTVVLCIELMQAPATRLPVQSSSGLTRRNRGDSNSNSDLNSTLGERGYNENINNNINISSSSTRLRQSKNLFINKIRGIESDSEIQARLHTIALQRLLVIRAALKV